MRVGLLDTGWANGGGGGGGEWQMILGGWNSQSGKCRFHRPRVVFGKGKALNWELKWRLKNIIHGDNGQMQSSECGRAKQSKAATAAVASNGDYACPV